MTLSAEAVQEISSEYTSTVWLTLITISHPDIGDPIRVTSDNVDTVFNGNTFLPFPHSVTLPDDTEGQIPEAVLTFSNVTQEIISIIRQITTAPKVTIQVIRVTDSDIVLEREWLGLEWQETKYDINTITGKLGVENLATEEFPYETFDTSFPGLWP